MTLSDYIAKKGISQAEFGRRIGKERAYVSRYCTSKSIPHPDTMRAIVDETLGAVQPNDFYQELWRRQEQC